MAEDDFTEPEKYDSWYEKYRDIYQKEMAFLQRLLEKDKFVEIGAGTGRFGGELGAFALVEVSEKMIKYALKKGYEYVRADGQNLPFRKDSVDSALFAFSLPFIKDQQRALKEAFYAAKKKIVIVDLDPELSKNYVDGLRSLYKSYDPSFIENVKRFDKDAKTSRLTLQIDSERVTLIGFVIHKQDKRI
ncbi:MAG: class I SAM-dependent methyltransferase [Nitrososphaeria archaeon]|jgi:ubiquinone/menaquinone biosynthesis C-methylase UbiE